MCVLDSNLKIAKTDLEKLIQAFTTCLEKDAPFPELSLSTCRIMHKAIQLAHSKQELNNLTIEQQNPVTKDSLKASLLVGMFVTFVESENIPGLISILKGILATGFGFGSINFIEPKVLTSKSSLSKLIKTADSILIADFQKKLFQNSINTEQLQKFVSIRRAMYCTILGCALLPIYSAAIAQQQKAEKVEKQHLEAAQSLIQKKFSHNAPGLTRLFSQSAFAQLFDSLFSHESTIISVFDF